MSDNGWLMRVESGLSAHFKEPDGSSRPGVHWAIGLKQGERTCTVLVKGLLADDATPQTREDQDYQARVAMQYLGDQLRNGWDPAQEMDHVIYIGNPFAAEPGAASAPAAVARKPWWQFW